MPLKLIKHRPSEEVVNKPIIHTNKFYGENFHHLEYGVCMYEGKISTNARFVTWNFFFNSKKVEIMQYCSALQR